MTLIPYVLVDGLIVGHPGDRDVVSMFLVPSARLLSKSRDCRTEPKHGVDGQLDYLISEGNAKAVVSRGWKQVSCDITCLAFPPKGFYIYTSRYILGYIGQIRTRVSYILSRVVC